MRVTTCACMCVRCMFSNDHVNVYKCYMKLYIYIYDGILYAAMENATRMQYVCVCVCMCCGFSEGIICPYALRVCSDGGSCHLWLLLLLCGWLWWWWFPIF